MTKATHIYHGGTILTMDSRASSVTHMAIANTIILAVGDKDDMASYLTDSTVWIDLKGKTMLPGFYDAHSHFMRAGETELFYINLSTPPVGTITCIKDIADRVTAHAKKTPKGEWILAAIYDETALEEKRHLTLEELDIMCPDHPIFIRHISGHTALANSKALAIGNITNETLDPTGGCIRRDITGKPNGLLEEPNAMSLVLKHAPAIDHEAWIKAAEKASEIYVAKGVTTAQEGGVIDAMWHAYMDANKRGTIKNRVQVLPKHGSFTMNLAPTSESGTSLTANNMLSIGAVKLFQDGSLQAYTGYLSNPYYRILVDDIENPEVWRGYPIFSQQDLTDYVTQYHKKGWQIAIHGNGDQAIDEILEAFEAAQKAYPRADARHIIIHCQTVREDQLDRIKRLGVVPSFFVTHTYYWGDRHRDIFLGEERAKRISPCQSALKRHIPFTAHNDTFVTPMDPLLSVWSAVNRLSSQGTIIGEAQRIDVVSALRAVTIWSAYQFCEEHIKGSLEPGKYADMVVLEENPCTVDPKHIKDIRIIATLVDNKLVYGAL